MKRYKAILRESLEINWTYDKENNRHFDSNWRFEINDKYFSIKTIYKIIPKNKVNEFNLFIKEINKENIGQGGTLKI